MAPLRVGRLGAARAHRCAARPLGEIVDIGINWSPTEGPVDLESIVTGARVIDRPGPRRPRLMMVEGRTACAKLLVVPYMTSQNLGATVMRCAAGLSASLEERDSKLWDLAHSLMGIAKAESAVWSGRSAPRTQSSSAPSSNIGACLMISA